MPGDVALVDIDKVWRILRAAERLHRALPAGPKPLWVTELHFTSSFPDSPAIQARFTALGLYELWRHDVFHVVWFDMQDPTAREGLGLYDFEGNPKPAAAAFRFPFVAVAGPRGQVILWGRAPHPGTVSIQMRDRGRWRKVLSLRTTSGGVFYAVSRLRAHRRLRAVGRGAISPTWVSG